MKSAVEEQRPQPEPVSFRLQVPSTSRGGLGVGRPHEISFFQQTWPFIKMMVIINTVLDIS